MSVKIEDIRTCIPPSSATNGVTNRVCNHSPYRIKELIQRLAPKARVEVNRDWK